MFARVSMYQGGAEQLLEGVRAHDRAPHSARGARARLRPHRLLGRSCGYGQRELSRQKVLALVRERPGITKPELRTAAAISSAGVAQNLRRMLARGQMREEALPGGAIGCRTANDGAAHSVSGEGESGL